MKPERIQRPRASWAPRRSWRRQAGATPLSPELAAIQLHTNCRVALHYDTASPVPDLEIDSAQDAARFFCDLLADEPNEVLLAAYLSARNRLIGWQRCFSGTLTALKCEPRLILQGALLTNAASLILAHNHPSGLAEPSAHDIQFSEQVRTAAALINVRLVDHIIVGTNRRCLSLVRHGVL